MVRVDTPSLLQLQSGNILTHSWKVFVFPEFGIPAKIDEYEKRQACNAENLEKQDSCCVISWCVHSNPVVEKPQHTKNRAKYIYWRGSSQIYLITRI